MPPSATKNQHHNTRAKEACRKSRQQNQEQIVSNNFPTAAADGRLLEKTSPNNKACRRCNSSTSAKTPANKTTSSNKSRKKPALSFGCCKTMSTKAAARPALPFPTTAKSASTPYKIDSREWEKGEPNQTAAERIRRAFSQSASAALYETKKTPLLGKPEAKLILKPQNHWAATK